MLQLALHRSEEMSFTERNMQRGTLWVADRVRERLMNDFFIEKIVNKYGPKVTKRTVGHADHVLQNGGYGSAVLACCQGNTSDAHSLVKVIHHRSEERESILLSSKILKKN